jgi:dynactin complex subunit
MEDEEQPLYKEFRSALREKTLRVLNKARKVLDENTILNYRIEMLTMEVERLHRELAIERERHKTRRITR